MGYAAKLGGASNSIPAITVANSAFLNDHGTEATRNRIQTIGANLKNSMFKIYKQVRLRDSQAGWSPARSYTNGATYTDIDSYYLQCTVYANPPVNITITVYEDWS